MTPSVSFSNAADQVRIRQLKLECSGMPQPGRVMFWRGRKLLGYGEVARLGDFLAIPKNADRVCVSEADYDDLKQWGFR